MELLTLEGTWNNVLPVLNTMFETTDDESNEKLADIIYPMVRNYCNVHGADLKKLKKLEKELAEKIRKENPTDQIVITTGSRRWRFYLKLEDFFTSFCRSLIKKSAYLADEDLLKFNIREWEKYSSKRQFLNWAFEDIGGHTRDEDSQIHEIGVLAVIGWKETLLKEYNVKIVKTAVDLLNRERQGEIIDFTLISNLIKYYLALGIDVDGKNDSIRVYKDHFERVLLEETKAFYGAYSTKFLRSHSLMEYLEEIEKIFRVEKRRVDLYFHSSTEEPLMKTLISSLIEKHLELFYCELKKCLTLDENDHISRMYLMLSRHIENLSEFAKVFEDHVVDQGLTSIESCGEIVKTDPKIYTDAILVIYKKYLNMVKYIFYENEYLMTALQNATKQYVNKNFVTLPPNTVRKTSQLVCKYHDELMRKKLFALNTACETPKLVAPSSIEVWKNGNRTNQVPELVNVLKELLIVFAFIEDKDVFHEYYLQFITKRLINDISTQDVDLESSMVIKMKSIIGVRYTKKFEKMIADIKSSIALNQNFAKANRKPLEVDFNVKVLQRCLWPFKVTSLHKLPFELEQCVTQFSTFYSKIYSKKRLYWLHDLSKGEIITNNFKKRYTIYASTMQISVLLLFNDSTSWALADIEKHTEIELDVLLEIIEIFLKIKLLICKNTDLTRNSMISLNEAYNNKKCYIRIDVPLKSIGNQEQQTTIIDRRIDTARIISVQTSIVKIMKSRKTMKKDDLFSQILKDLALQFKPDIETIKKCIELVIEKKFIQRSSTEASTFIYVP